MPQLAMCTLEYVLPHVTVASPVKGGQYLLQSSEDSLRQTLAQYYGHDQHSALIPQLHVINLDKLSVVVPSYMMNEFQVISTM